jgi:hypothetical protein
MIGTTATTTTFCRIASDTYLTRLVIYVFMANFFRGGTQYIIGHLNQKIRDICESNLAKIMRNV